MVDDYPSRSVPPPGADPPPDPPFPAPREILRLVLLLATLVGLCLMLYLLRQVWGELITADTI